MSTNPYHVDDDQEVDADFLNGFLGDIDLRLRGVEAQRQTIDDALQDVSTLAIQRLNEILLPSLQTLYDAEHLGFLNAPVSGPAVLDIGASTVTIDAARRHVFTPSPWVAFVRDSVVDFAVGKTQSYNQTTGELIVNISNVSGTPGTYSDVTVWGVAGGALSALESATQTSADRDATHTDMLTATQAAADTQAAAILIEGGPVSTVNGQAGVVSLAVADIPGAAPLASPPLTGTPTAPTAAPGTNTTQISTTEFVTAAIAALIASAPGALDTLNELAAALGDDANFASTMTTALAAKEAAANKGAANGYAGLDANGKVSASQLNWTTVVKPADESRTSTTTLADDADITFALAANTKYRFRANLFITGGAGGFKFRTSGPASPALVRISSLYSNGSGPSLREETAYSTSDIQVSSGADVRIDGVIRNGANAGDFHIEWAQTVSDASPAKILAGSYIEYASV